MKTMTREEEIKKLKDFLHEIVYKNGGWYRIEDIVDCVIKWADEHQKNPWISVEECMPDENSAVLVRGEMRDNGHADEFYVFLVENGEFVSALSGKPIWKLDTFRNYTFTHWMPIPELKKGGKI